MHQFETFIINNRKLFDSLVWFETQIESDLFVLDLETDSEIEKTAKIYGIGICFTDKKAFYIPWRNKDASLVWNDADAIYIVQWLRNTLHRRKVIGHNIIYDTLVLENNFGITIDNLIHADTILQKHTLEEEPPFALKEIGTIILGPWADKAQDKLKDNVLANGGKWSKEQKDMYLADTDILGEYCCWDVMITLLLYFIFDKKLADEGLTKFFYEDEVMPLYKEVTINMKRKGFRVDVAYFEKLKVDLTNEINRLEDEILKDISTHTKRFEEDLLEKKHPWNNAGNFPKFYADVAGIPLPIDKKSGKTTLARKGVELQKKQNPEYSNLYDYLLDISPRTPLDPYVAMEAQRKMFFHANPDKRYIFNLASGDHVGYLLFTALAIKPFKFTDGGKPSTDKEVLDELIEQHKAKEPWMEKLFDYRKLGKLLSTYVEGILDRQIDGIIFTSMLQFGTTSGRYASSNPNLQNQPRIKDNDSGLTVLVLGYVNAIKKGFIAGEGYKVVNADYASLEPVCFAHASGDEKLRDVFRKGEDLYSRVGIETFKLQNVSAKKKDSNYLGTVNNEMRQKCKEFVLMIPYGAEEAQVSRKMGVDYKEAGEIRNAYLNSFPNLRKYMNKCNYLAKTEGIAKTELGRIRHLPQAKSIHTLYGDQILDYKFAKKNNKSDIRALFRNLLNNSKNFPIQGLAAHIVNRAMIATMREFRRLGLDAWVALQVHDEITCIAREDQAELAAQVLQECMEKTTVISVPLKAEPMIADNWADSK